MHGTNVGGTGTTEQVIKMIKRIKSWEPDISSGHGRWPEKLLSLSGFPTTNYVVIVDRPLI